MANDEAEKERIAEREMRRELRFQTFNNGLSPEHHNELLDIEIDINRLILRIEGLGRHRSYSSAITKLDEAWHWLRDRQNRAP